MERFIATVEVVQGSRGRAVSVCAVDVVGAGVFVWSPRISWLDHRQSARGCLWGEGVEISDQVVDQFYMGVRGECW